MEKLFKLADHKTDFRTEILAGLTTFLTMAYILIVNPLILSDTGMDFGALFTATALASAIATLVMAFTANLPFALAPGMGLNAFFAYTVVLGMGYSWQFALTAVFLEGIIFILLTILNIREAIINCIPTNVKKAISVGIGLFIAFIGFQNAGIIINDDATLVILGDLTSGAALLAVIGLLITGILLAFKVKGALLIGIIATTVVGIPFGITSAPSGSWAPPSLSPILFKFEFASIFSFDMLIVLFTFLFVDMFDTVGTLIGVSTKAGLLDKDGNIPKVKQALMADAVGTTVGACLGTSTVTTYVESSAGVAEGGKTGLTALTTAVLFLLALFISPLFLAIPGAATAPALILVGLFMITPVKEIDFNDYTEAIPAFLTLIVMPLAYSIADGIMLGMLSWILLKLLSGKSKEINILTIVVGILFLLKLLVG
jgi:AGZA family xanthine/uracil permease-like MFS transporter